MNPRPRLIRRLAVVLALATAAAGAYADGAGRGLAPAPFAVELSGTIRDRGLLEASGMAASRRRDALLWMHNDSGSQPAVFAVSRDGRTLGRVAVRGATGRDWEDMASFDFEGRPMLLVADVGDNDARRSNAWLHVFEEPVVGPDGIPADAFVEVAWSVPFRYPTGAADCEAVAVDVEAGQVLLMTKRQNPPQLYAVPLRPDGAAPRTGRVLIAERVAAVTSIPRPRAEDLLQDPMFGVYGSQPTGMDLAGDQLIVLTYLHAYVFLREQGGSWADAVARPPRIVVLPRMRQAESIAFDRNGVDAFVSSEKRNAPIYRLVRRDQSADAAAAPRPSH